MYTSNFNEQTTEIRHYDLYRIAHISELQEIDIVENLASSITIIEWPEKFEKYLPNSNTITIQFSYYTDDMRHIAISNLPHLNLFC